MDFESRLKLIKKERRSRMRPDSINKAWREIDKNAGLSTKDKLERLINLTQSQGKKPTKPPAVETQLGRPFQVFESRFSCQSRYGRIPLSAGLQIDGRTLALLSRSSAFEELDLSTALFLDLETTGLSGGVGTVPFLVGLGFFKDGCFEVLQFFLGDLAEEESLIGELSRLFASQSFRSIVSFNGKTFDLPLLETRFVLHREEFTLSGLPHLDFLFSARSLWRHKHESCRLFHLAREVLQAERGEDIPPSEIPLRYFQYLRSGDFSLIEPILYHNQEDLLSLLGVVIVGASLFSSEERGGEVFGDAMDLFGAARIVEKAGDVDKSVDFIRRALEGKLSSEVQLQAKKRLALYLKKAEKWEEAIHLWEEIAPLNQLSCFRELAMYYEHREKNYAKAKEISEQGLVLAAGISPVYEGDFIHRLERLGHKMDRQDKKAGKK